MAITRQLFATAALLMLTIEIYRCTMCYFKRNVDNSCRIEDLNRSVIDCPGHCRRKMEHDETYRCTMCYFKRNVDESCKIEDLNKTICTGNCKRKRSEDVQVLTCADEDEAIGYREETDVQKETNFKIDVCKGDLCNECAESSRDNPDDSLDPLKLIGICVGAAIVLGALIVFAICMIRRRGRQGWETK